MRGGFAGTALLAQQSSSQQWVLIAAALIVIYIVLGVLYESLVHPMTVLSTLPSAGVGAVLALLLFRMDFTMIALIGVFLLIGIVKKNAILIIDFALEAERARGLTPFDAVREACLLRFRPILMTTLAAALGALPLAIGFGEGAELRRPLGVAIIGGLIASQLLTLLTTPVVYLLLDKLRRRGADERHLSRTATIASQPARRGRRMSARRAALLPLLAATLRRCFGLHGRPGVPAPGRRGTDDVQGSAAGRRFDVVPGGARRRARSRAVVGAVRRPGAVVAREQVEVSNQNVAAAVAAYAQAQALVSQQRAALFPSLGLDAGATRNGGGRARSASGSNLRLGFTASWEPDIWGQLRLAVTGAQASAAGECREPRRGAAVGAGGARDRLFRAARGRQRDRAADQRGDRLRARAAASRRTSTTPASRSAPTCCRRRRSSRRRSADLSATVGTARAARARDRAARRQGAGRVRASPVGAVERDAFPPCRSSCPPRCCSAGRTSPRPSAPSRRRMRRSASSAPRISRTSG